MTASGGSKARDGKTDKRERILDAAVRVFAEKSYYTATVAEIAREAGVADGTIYLYFKSKDDLLISLFEKRMGELNAAMKAVVAEAKSPSEQLRAFIRFHLRAVQDSPQVAEVLVVELRQSAKLMKEYKAVAFGAYLDILSDILSRGAEEGAFRDDLDVKGVRRAIFGALDELALSWLLARRRFDLQKNAEQLASIFVRGLARQEER